jgi:hypothetical protein
MKYFKKYSCLATWFDEDTKKIHTFTKVFNLFDVDSYLDAKNELEGFQDNVKRTVVDFNNGKAVCIVVPFEEFDSIFTEAMKDSQLMDLTAGKKKEQMPFEAKYKYSGAIKYTFVKTPTLLSCRVTPKDYMSEGKPNEEVMANIIGTTITYFN